MNVVRKVESDSCSKLILGQDEAGKVANDVGVRLIEFFSSTIPQNGFVGLSAFTKILDIVLDGLKSGRAKV